MRALIAAHHDEIVVLLNEGKTTPQISRALGIGRVSLFKYLKRAGLVAASAIKDLTFQEEALMVEAISGGDLSNAQLASMFNCGVTLIKKIKNRHDLLLPANQAKLHWSAGGKESWRLRTERGTAIDGRNGPESVLKRAATRRTNEAIRCGFVSPEEKYKQWAANRGGSVLGSVAGSFDNITWVCSVGHQWQATPHNCLVNGTWCPSCTCGGPSDGELEVLEYVRSLCPNAATNRGVIAPMHLDVYVDSLGIEYNGLLYHSTFYGKEILGRHIRKALLCREAKVDLLAIFEDEWRNKQDLVKAMIRWRLGKFNGVALDARKLELKRLGKNKEFNWFFERNHLDRHTLASYAWGLFNENKLVCCASFRTNANGEFELARLATDYDYNVRGGVSRLLAQVNEPLTSFSNNRLSTGEVYEKLGFKLVQENGPSYWYTDLKTRIGRWSCRRINDPLILAQFPNAPHKEQDQALAGMMSMEIFGDLRPLWKIEDYGHRKWIRP